MVPRPMVVPQGFDLVRSGDLELFSQFGKISMPRSFFQVKHTLTWWVGMNIGDLAVC